MQQSPWIRSFIGTHKHDWKDNEFHHHERLEITAVLNGRGLFEWERTISLEAGHVVIIPAHLSHRFSAVTQIRFGVIHLDALPVHLMELFSMLTGEQAPAIIALSRLDKDQYERLFREWLRIMSSTLKEKARNYAAWMEVILLFLYEHLQANKQALTIMKAADYIRENLQNPIQISDLSALAGLSDAGFRKQFAQSYHMTPKQYQQQCRMSEAKWLLSSSDKEIQEIAEQIGFSRLHSFSQWFKTMEALSPSEWRNIQRLNFD